MDLKDKTLYTVIGAVIVAIVNLGLFASKADIANLETKMHQTFVQRQELKDQLQFLIDQVKDIKDTIKDKGK